MTFYKAGCAGNYDFERVSEFARKRFIAGISLDTLVYAGCSKQAQEEAALISELDKTHSHIRSIDITCPHQAHCRVKNCQNIFLRLLSDFMARHQGTLN